MVSYLYLGLALYTLYWVLRSYFLIRDFHSWSKVQGVVTVSEATKFSYIFEVNEKPYKGEDVKAGGDTDWAVVLPWKVYGRSMADKYPVGKIITVYYDPKNPKRSSLEEGGFISLYFEIAIFILLTYLAYVTYVQK